MVPKGIGGAPKIKLAKTICFHFDRDPLKQGPLYCCVTTVARAVECGCVIGHSALGIHYRLDEWVRVTVSGIRPFSGSIVPTRATPGTRVGGAASYTGDSRHQNQGCPMRGASHFGIGTCKIGVTVDRGYFSGLKGVEARASVVLWEARRKERRYYLWSDRCTRHNSKFR